MQNESNDMNQPAQDESSRLEAIRSQIDQTDRKIIELLLNRANYVKEVGQTKHNSGSAIYRPDREKQVYQNIHKYVKEISNDNPSMPVEVFEHIYREIMSGSIALEGGPAVAYLGPEASFSHQATRNRFGASLRLKPVDSIEEIFRVVENGHDASFGVVPVENTIAGTVGQTFDNLLHTDLKIYAEHYIRIEMNLLSKKAIELNQIQKLYTLKIVYDQCRNWLNTHLNTKELQIIQTASTAEAASLAAQNPGSVAIASEFAAQTYDLKVIAHKIQDNSFNLTRFFVIGNEQCPPTGDDKTSIVCTINDSPGSLYKILQSFEKQKINLTRIESRATRRLFGEYHFFIDFAGHNQDPSIRSVLQEIKSSTTMLKILGSYPRMAIPGSTG